MVALNKQFIITIDLILHKIALVEFQNPINLFSKRTSLHQKTGRRAAQTQPRNFSGPRLEIASTPMSRALVVPMSYLFYGMILKLQYWNQPASRNHVWGNFTKQLNLKKQFRKIKLKNRLYRFYFRVTY